MKHSLLLTSLTLIAASGLAQAAAAPASAFTTTGNLSFTSDYVFRGITQNGGKTALQGGFDVSHTDGLSAGVWAANVNWANTTLEVDAYAAYGFSLTKDITASVGYIGYIYEGNSALNTSELNVSATAYGLTAKISYATTHYFGIAGSGTKYYELNYAYDIAAVKGLSLALHYGLTDGKSAASNDKDYAIALSYPVLGFTGTLAYSNGSGSYAGIYEGITAVSLKKTF
ncbi:MAG: TorF family putative porin [Verrucomicrobia bacterium]|nr:TorF family putative porin [Verrucomicrobiota bacterium]